jgi:hypothetical protein
MKSFMIRTDLIKKNEIGGERSTYGVREEARTVFCYANLRERNYLEDLCADGRKILKWLLKIGWGNVDWIHLAEDRGKWPAIVNTAVRFRKTYRIFYVVEELLTFEVGL